MNPQENPDYKRKLQELEKELGNDRTAKSEGTQPGQWGSGIIDSLHSQKALVHQAMNWYKTLPDAGKVAVAIACAVVGFSLLRMVLQLVASLISLTLLGVTLYLVYKFVIAPQSPK
ncbi:MAG TPA: hypothetical protein V6C95_08235 [Coleofasciculaceae cyanobacterium]